MPKIIYLLFAMLFLIPGTVIAEENVYYRGYRIGDEITVTLDKAGKVKSKFIVIKKSDGKLDEKGTNKTKLEAENYQFVTAIYYDTIGTSVFTNNYSDTSVNDSKAYINLLTMLKMNGWENYQNVRLFTRADLTSMISTLPVKNQNEIYGRNKECTVNSCPILPVGVMNMESVKKYLPFIFLDTSYWIGESSYMANADCGDSDYCIAVMENYANVMSSDGFDKLKASSTASLRPVITIHKSYIDNGIILNCVDCEIEDRACPDSPNISIQSCIDNGWTEEICIEQICQAEESYDENEFYIIHTCDDVILLVTAVIITGIILFLVYIISKKIG